MRPFDESSSPPNAFHLLLSIFVVDGSEAFVLAVYEGAHILLTVFKRHDSFSVGLLDLDLAKVDLRRGVEDLGLAD